MLGFTMGAIVGGIAMWVWGEDLRRYMSSRGRDMRYKAAETLQSVQDTAESALDTAREQVTSTLQSGQDAIRPRVS